MKGKGELARGMTAKSRLSNAMLLTRVVLGLVPTVLVIYLVHLFLDGTLSPTGYLKRPRPPSFPPPHSSSCSQWTGGSLCACWRAYLSWGS